MGILSSGIVRETPPKDGVWQNGKWVGAGYTSWGWNEDLNTLDDIELVDVFGATEAQIWAGLSATPEGWLHWSPAAAIAAGADPFHGFKFFSKPRLWKSEAFFLTGRVTPQLWNSGGGRNRVVFGAQTVNSVSEPYIVSGYTDSLVYDGISITPTRPQASLDGPKTGSSMATVGCATTIHFSPDRQLYISAPSQRAPVILHSSGLAGVNEIYDKRIEMNEKFFWRPFVEVVGDGDAQFWNDSSVTIRSFKIMGIPNLA